MGYALTIERARSRNLPSASSYSHYRGGFRFLLLVLAIAWALSSGLLWPTLRANYKGRFPRAGACSESPMFAPDFRRQCDVAPVNESV